MMAKSLGDRGVTDSEIKGMKDKAEHAFDYVMSNRGKGLAFLLDLRYPQRKIWDRRAFWAGARYSEGALRH